MSQNYLNIFSTWYSSSEDPCNCKEICHVFYVFWSFEGESMVRNFYPVLKCEKVQNQWKFFSQKSRKNFFRRFFFPKFFKHLFNIVIRPRKNIMGTRHLNQFICDCEKWWKNGFLVKIANFIEKMPKKRQKSGKKIFWMLQKTFSISHMTMFKVFKRCLNNFSSRWEKKIKKLIWILKNIAKF